MNKVVYILLFLFVSLNAHARDNMSGQVLDATTKEPVPFATIKFGVSGTGTIADLDGKFEIKPTDTAGLGWIEISCLGYTTKRVLLPENIDNIYLSRSDNSLREVVIRPPYEKMRRIIDLAIANKPVNNPDKINWYQCRVYYKMAVDVLLPDSMKNDTSKDIKEFMDITDHQHLLMSETYSRRTWKKPQTLQEDVSGTRVSGLERSFFTGLVTDVLPFHAYNNYLSLNNKDYHNPISKGYEQYYEFNLSDELVQDRDTIWVLTFKPKGHNSNELKGTVTISSDGFGIANLVARCSDTILKREVRIEQQYRLVNADGERHWFPARLNYIIDWVQRSKKAALTYHLKGNSMIDSVSFSEDPGFEFDKKHTVRLHSHADELPDSAWKSMRPEPLDNKEARTYEMVDSFGRAKKMDRFMTHLSGLPEGRVGIGLVDIDLKRLFSSNYYENVRLGIGLQTNEKWIRWLSIGGWAGYGLSDAKWKFGVFSEIYANRTRDFAFRLGYSDDINDPGRVHLDKNLDKNYLNAYLLSRVDHVVAYTAGVKKKFGYLGVEVTGTWQEIAPLYRYALNYNGREASSFLAKEVSVNFRYAFAERTAPFFGSYYSTGSKYPILYGKLTNGMVTGNDMNSSYTQLVAALSWQKHLNRVGNERIMVKSGALWNDAPLPLSKLFAGNGYRYDVQSGTGIGYYVFGGMVTMYPYDFYTDRFINAILRHDFDWKLYQLKIPKTKLSSSPFIGLQYGLLYGTLQHPEAQRFVGFRVPDNAYHEAGIMVNNIIRSNAVDLYYITLNMGYFYHVIQAPYSGKNGKMVIGFGLEF